MSFFDERAEGAATRRQRDGDNGIPAAEVRALKKALGTQHRKLEEDLSSVDVLLHTDPANPNAPVEDGPPLPGTFAFTKGVEFLGRVADDIRAIQATVSRANIDKKDRQVIVDGLHDLAKAWDERSRAFGTGDEPAAAAAKYRTAHEFERSAVPARKILEKYFPDESEDE